MLDAIQRRYASDLTFLGPDEAEPTATTEIALRSWGSIPDAPATEAHDAFFAMLRTNASAAVGAPALSRDDRVGQKLDDLRAAYAGPYHVDGQTVTAPAMFRMNGGFNNDNAKKHGVEVSAIAKRAGVNAFGALNGCASPSDVVKVTQALIDAGKLPAGPGDLATRIRAMQWEYGIGVDCAAYTRMALQAATGKAEHVGLAGLGSEGFRNLGTNAHFAKLTPERARPGDIMTLDDPVGDGGHNVIVRSRTTLDDAAKQALVGKWGSAASAFFAGPGPFHAIEVDSSWGAGPDGASYGGVRREIWYYDEGTKTWGSINIHEGPPHFQVGMGPDNEKFHGTYRVKGEG